MNARKVFLFLFFSILAGSHFFIAQAALAGIYGFLFSLLDVIRLLVAVIFLLAIAVFGWGIVKYLYAAGDANKVKDARQILWWGILGIFVLAAIYSLVIFIGDQLGIDAGSSGFIVPPSIQIPQSR